jgi:hypothetical protein
MKCYFFNGPISEFAELPSKLGLEKRAGNFNLQLKQ